MIACKVRKWGNSLGVIIPKEVALQLGIKSEDTIVVRIEKRENPLKELFGLLAKKNVTREMIKQWRRDLEGERI